MEIQEIEITIDKNGQVQLHVRGLKGKKCLELTSEVEAALGGQVLERQMTPEALENESGNEIDQSIEVKS